MNKFFYLMITPYLLGVTLTAALITLTACNIPSAAAMPQSSQPPAAAQPAAIQDAVLLEGWKVLYNHQDAIQMPDGSTMTGHELAQFVVDNAIPVLWTPTDDSHKTSYSTIACSGDACTYANDQPGVAPLYITSSIKDLGNDRMQQLVERMAHEIYHRMQPFGHVHITLFEEYSAYYVSMQISQANWAQFKGYDARNPACLTRWFNDTNLMYAYKHLGLYPQSVVSMVNSTSQTCRLDGDPTEQTTVTADTSTQTNAQSEITCTVNNEGVAVCKNK